MIAERHMLLFSENKYFEEFEKHKFHEIIYEVSPTNDLNCPAYIIKGKAIKQQIFDTTDRSTK